MKNKINQIIGNKNYIKNYLLPFLLVFTFLLRLIFVFFVRDSGFDNEWGILLNNLIIHKSYSFYSFEGQLIPSVLLPPMYPFFLYSTKMITSFDQDNLLYFVILIQIIFSTYSVYLFYQINKFFFSNNVSFFNTFIFSIIPINVYACGQISSINLQIILTLLFLKFLLIIINNNNLRNIIIFSIVSGILILTRGEFILILALIILFIFFNEKINVNNLLIIGFIVLLIISPYVVRNYKHFNQVIIVKSLGYNLWKGNNKLSKVEGYENFKKTEFSDLRFKVNNIKKDKYYEIKRDKVFLEQALKNLNEDSLYYTKLYFKKFFSFLFININSSYPNYYNFFNIVPIILISILSLPGIYIFYKKSKFENKCIGIYFFINLIIFSFFFILPRYKLILLPIQVIFASNFILYLLKRINKK